MGVPECKLSQKGGEYVGVKDKTISGFDCIPWLDQDSSDVDRIRGLRKGSFSDELTSSHNFCRNSNGNPGGPWCNIKVPGKPKLNWEYCDVSFCNFDASQRAIEYGNQYKSKWERTPLNMYSFSRVPGPLEEELSYGILKSEDTQ
ncbi:unnamed protein product [Darwinula stevensoni]|uniref:Kringle domain-containing protein n=1 Tax=Darwinula stevensoni TaxID=69355 RepID=A0A7R9A7M0_9CRUS|nr:unnamed protein product [Darwinula stevensoni]CAG0893997.1 unnamed protein product [Darwinula stevensoni]